MLKHLCVCFVLLGLAINAYADNFDCARSALSLSHDHVYALIICRIMIASLFLLSFRSFRFAFIQLYLDKLQKHKKMEE